MLARGSGTGALRPQQGGAVVDDAARCGAARVFGCCFCLARIARVGAAAGDGDGDAGGLPEEAGEKPNAAANLAEVKMVFPWAAEAAAAAVICRERQLARAVGVAGVAASGSKTERG